MRHNGKKSPWSQPAVLLLVLTPCIAAYLMLDAPTAVIAWVDSGLVLALSHATPFALWAFALNVLYSAVLLGGLCGVRASSVRAPVVHSQDSQ